MKTKYIIGSLLLGLAVSSCVVSKKKYETLYLAKRASDRKVRSLLNEKSHLNERLEDKQKNIFSLQNKLRGLKEEFNNFKYDMSASNAQKSSQIDKLSQKLGSTLKDSESVKEKTQELETDLEWLRKERQEHTAQIDSLQVSLSEIKREIRITKEQNNRLSSDKTSNEKKISNLQSKVNALEELLKREKALNIKLQKQLKATPKKATPKYKK